MTLSFYWRSRKPISGSPGEDQMNRYLRAAGIIRGLRDDAVLRGRDQDAKDLDTVLGLLWSVGVTDEGDGK